MFFLYYVSRTGSGGLTSAEQMRLITSLNLLSMMVVQPKMLPAVLAALLARVQPAVPRGPFGRAAPRPGCAQAVSLQGVCSPQVPGFAFVLLDFTRFRWPIPLSCPRPSGWQPCPLAC